MNPTTTPASTGYTGHPGTTTGHPTTNPAAPGYVDPTSSTTTATGYGTHPTAHTTGVGKPATYTTTPGHTMAQDPYGVNQHHGRYDPAASDATSRGIQESIIHGQKAADAKIDQKHAEVSKEAHWTAAKDQDMSKRDRLSDAVHAAGDFIEEKSKGAKAKAHTEAAKHKH